MRILPADSYKSGLILCSSDFLFNFAALFSRVQGMYGLKKIICIVAAVLLVGLAAFIPSYDGMEECPSAEAAAAVFTVPSFNASFPAVEGYMELSTFSNAVSSASAAGYRPVQACRIWCCPVSGQPDGESGHISFSCQDPVPCRLRHRRHTAHPGGELHRHRDKSQGI